MVHKQVYPLLALALEGLELAKQLFIYRLVAHCAALALAITAAVALHCGSEGVEIAAAFGAIMAEFAALCLHHRAMELHTRGRQAMRRVMLLDGLRPEEAPAVLERARPHFGTAVRRSAAALEESDGRLEEKDQRLANYYYSSKPPGQARLRDHLFESAIFSHHLYGAAWKFSLACMIVLLGAAAVVLVFLVPHTTRLLGFGTAHAEEAGLATLAVRLVVALVAFLPACQELDHLLLYRMVEHHLGELLGRVEALYAEPDAGPQPGFRLLAEFGDYSAATTFAPPIRTLVYRRLVGRLRDEFEAKMAELDRGKTSAPPAGALG
jgi:hypothetical protein